MIAKMLLQSLLGAIFFAAVLFIPVEVTLVQSPRGDLGDVPAWIIERETSGPMGCR